MLVISAEREEGRGGRWVGIEVKDESKGKEDVVRVGKLSKWVGGG